MPRLATVVTDACIVPRTRFARTGVVTGRRVRVRVPLGAGASEMTGTTALVTRTIGIEAPI